MIGEFPYHKEHNSNVGRSCLQESSTPAPETTRVTTRGGSVDRDVVGVMRVGERGDGRGALRGGEGR